MYYFMKRNFYFCQDDFTFLQTCVRKSLTTMLRREKYLFRYSVYTGESYGDWKLFDTISEETTEILLNLILHLHLQCMNSVATRGWAKYCFLMVSAGYFFDMVMFWELIFLWLISGTTWSFYGPVPKLLATLWKMFWINLHYLKYMGRLILNAL